MTSPRPPGPANLRRDIIIAVAIMTALAAVTTGVALTYLRVIREDRAWVARSHDVIDQSLRLFSLVQDVESGERGLLATRDERFLDAFDASLAKVPAEERRLQGLVQGDPGQSARARQLVDLVNQRVSIAAQRVNLARQGHYDQALTVRFASGRDTMQRLRASQAALMTAEQKLLVERTLRAEREDRTSALIVMGLRVTSLLVLAGLVFSLMRANRLLTHVIGQREASEEERRANEAQYRATFDNTADHLFVVTVTEDGDFRIADVNPAFERAVGVKAGDLKGAPIVGMVKPERRDAFRAHLTAITLGDRPAFTRDEVFLPAGQRTWESVIAPVRDAGGRVTRLVGSSRDVTERDRAREQLRRAARMEAVGQLTGGVAHDFNNLLQVIRGNLELIAAQLGEGPSTARIRNALHATERAGQLTSQLLAFARRQPLQPKVINLGRLVTGMADMLRRTLGESTQVETLIADDLWNTLADPAQVESAVLNLALNARDAMDGGGRLSVEVSNLVLSRDNPDRPDDVAPGDYVLIAVSDTGHGMDKETLAKVFEPFFTTKGEEKGTGLGLSMVYGFVKQSEGHVQIASEPGQGTTVRILLPRSPDIEQVEDAAPAGSLRGRSEVILLVEDDEMVRTSAVSMLRDLGYTCIHAGDGAQALNVLKSGVRIDLLFTDVVMPGPVKGRDLASQAQALRPGLPVLFTSGYTEDAIVHHGRLDEGLQLLSKPYSRDGLARKIRSILKPVRPVVLVVEDDALVRLSAMDMIDALGFSTLQAPDAPAALAILDRGERVDILFTDIGLPGMRGSELALTALRMRPGLKVVFASGYGETDETAAITDAAHLGKPYEQDQLAEILTNAVN